MAEEKKIVTLVAEAGRQWDEKKEAIGTHGRSIVFLPRGVNPGEKVRVELEEVRADARGRMMYRGRPTPVQKETKWVERDGKLEQLELSVDWKLQETELKVLESRPIVRRDGEARKSSTFTVDWATSLMAARVTVTTKTEIFEVEEHIDASYGTTAPYERVVAVRDGGEISETFAVDGIEPIRSGYYDTNDWLDSRLRTSYAGEPNLYVRFRLTYSGDQTVESNASKWADLPTWMQDHLSALNPVCGCGRERVDAASAQTVCSHCRREAEFEQSFSMERRQELAAQAAKLATVEPVAKEVGEIILKTSFAHVRDTFRRNSLVAKSTGYAWYYFCDDGVYGAKFPAAALQVLAHLASASGQGLMELVGWIAGPHKPSEYRPEEYEQSYYVRTQLMGEQSIELVLPDGELKSMVVAERLCGSMANRQAALDGVATAKATFGERDPRVSEIDQILQDERQDFGLALGKIREIEATLSAQERGEVLVNFGGHFRRMGATGNNDHWVIRPDGSLREPDEQEGRQRHESSEGSKFWRLVGTDELAISWGKGTTASLHSFTVAKLPANGVTQEQRRAAVAIEEEIFGSYHGMYGKESPPLGCGWGFGSGTVEGRMAQREQAVKAALRRSRVLRVPEHIDMPQASMREGVWMNSQDMRGRVLIPNRDPDEEFNRGRERAWVVETLPAGDGAIEVLAVERSRNDRPEIRYRWVRRTDGPDPDTAASPTVECRETASQPVQKAEQIDLSKIDLSGLFGGGVKQRR